MRQDQIICVAFFFAAGLACLLQLLSLAVPTDVVVSLLSGLLATTAALIFIGLRDK